MEIGELVDVDVPAPGSESSDEKAEKPSWLELELADEEGTPLAFEEFQVELADGSIREGKLDAKGKSRLRGLKKGDCKISFPRLAAGEWKPA
jgi:hypothetical protein